MSDDTKSDPRDRGGEPVSDKAHFTWEQAAADILVYHEHLKRKGIKVEAIEMIDDTKLDPRGRPLDRKVAAPEGD